MKRALIGLMSFLLTAAAFADTRIDESAEVDPRGQVSISNVSGSVEVTGWDKNEVSVRGRLGSGAERLEFVPSGGRTEINVILPRKSRHAEGTDLEIRVPVNSRLDIDTVSADITVRGVEGAQRLQAVSGDLIVEVFGEDVEARTVSGDMDVNGQNTPTLLTLTAVSGDMTVRRVSGELMVNTVSGDLEVTAGQVRQLRARTTSGDIEIAASLDSGAHVDIETINGEVTLGLSGSRAGEYDLETFNGDIRTCFGPKARRTSRYEPGRELQFNEGDADTSIRIKTLNGVIDVCDR